MENNYYYQIGFSHFRYIQKEGNVYYHSEVMENNAIRVIECDMDKKWMKVKTKSSILGWKEIGLKKLKKDDIIKLKNTNMRWEGNSLNGSPFGYGMIYNNNNKVIYEGFIFENMKVCYGKEIYDDVGTVEYEGSYYQNKRSGYGMLFDKKKELVYQGEWINDNPKSDKNGNINRVMNKNDLYVGMENIIIEDNCQFNGDSFILDGLTQLKTIRIGRECMKDINRFELKSIVIMMNSTLRSS